MRIKFPMNIIVYNCALERVPLGASLGQLVVALLVGRHLLDPLFLPAGLSDSRPV